MIFLFLFIISATGQSIFSGITLTLCLSVLIIVSDYQLSREVDLFRVAKNMMKEVIQI